MSELLSAAAAALGTPEALVKRSAEARAEATGASVDEILQAWAGGAPAQAPAQEAETVPAPSEEEAPAPAEAPAEEEPAPEIIVETPSLAPPPPAQVAQPAGPVKPPVLVGASDNPMRVLTGVLGLFLVVLLVGLVGPSIQSDPAGARTSHIDFGAAALDGRGLYLSLGCASCHTQMVRPVVADVGLGAVTLNDTNQVLGTRRFGPDLSNVGARLTAAQIEATIAGLGGHLSHNLSADDMAALVAYLTESVTAEPTGEEGES